MPREKDSEKRASIIAAAKRLIAERGFHATTVGDIARAVDIPVGSVYTYFETKEALVASVIEEGWLEFRAEMEAGLAAESDPARRLALVTDRYLPELFRDVDFIALLITEAPRMGGLEDKLGFLSALVASLISDLSRRSGKAIAFSGSQARAALLVFFLGSMDAVRLMRRMDLGATEEDILAFIRSTIANTFGGMTGA